MRTTAERSPPLSLKGKGGGFLRTTAERSPPPFPLKGRGGGFLRTTAERGGEKSYEAER